LLLVAIFLAFRVSDALMLFAAGPLQQFATGWSIITTGIWTTALLVAIAYRKTGRVTS
jgi:hypothetical protein